MIYVIIRVSIRKCASHLRAKPAAGTYLHINECCKQDVIFSCMRSLYCKYVITLRTESCRSENSVITGGIEGCRYGKMPCLRRRQTLAIWQLSIFIARTGTKQANRRDWSLTNAGVIMTTMASQITSLTVVYSTVYSDADQRKHQISASLAFVWGIHRDR